MEEDNSNNMVDKEAMVLREVPIREEAKVVISNNTEVNNKLMVEDKDMVVDKPMVEDKDTVHTDNKEVNKVELMEVTCHLPVKSNSHNMEVHHIHNLMDQQCRKIYLKINRKEKFSLVVLVVILKKMFTIISLNSEQLKIISLKDVQ